MAAEGKAIDALSQFELTPFLGVLGESVRFSQANAHMLLAVGMITALMIWGTASRAIVPGRVQALAESFYEFVHDLVVGQVGQEGRRFFPFVFTLFMFILLGNLLGLLPFAFTYTSHIAVTFGLALIVFVLITVVGIAIHGWHWFSYFLPEGAPKVLAPLIIVIEVISYLSRPISLSVRLFANMVAGHVLLTVFAVMCVELLKHNSGIYQVFFIPLPFFGLLFMTAFEILVALLQAYIFTILAAVYIGESVHPEH